MGLKYLAGLILIIQRLNLVFGLTNLPKYIKYEMSI